MWSNDARDSGHLCSNRTRGFTPRACLHFPILTVTGAYLIQGNDQKSAFFDGCKSSTTMGKLLLRWQGRYLRIVRVTPKNMKTQEHPHTVGKQTAQGQ